ncbi:PD-(D/E)XK nuclease family protein [Stygiolobus caldivivus]|uniref:PD-(D/E)XK nuclease family protein n=1 Tax=Stygiolobus caldivivus TaxID=2824673 RepID=UPI001C8541D4|nr:PD-(D/E)XK nuclease family protein [Stygiolobus caldivivus]
MNNDEKVDYSEVQRYEDFLTQLQLPYAKECGNLLKNLDSKVSHLPRVTSIASGVGHCIYEAKLKELLGVKGVISSSFPGKGTTVHKLLALASLHVFGKNEFPGDMVKFFRELARELEDASIEDEKILTAVDIFSSLLSVKDELFTIIGVKQDNVRPIVEQQLYDYDLHMLGVPDLILEDIENKKAVVVEWKTYNVPPDKVKRNSVSSYEKAQVTAYAMLEARRLGYEITPDNYDEPSLYDAISGRLTDGRIEDVRVLPVVIRPCLKENKRLTLPPHPVLSDRGDIRDRYKKFRETLGEIFVTARYLTYLVTNFALYGYDKKTDFEDCFKQVGNQNRIVFLSPPPYPIPRGKPSSQEKSGLCRFCQVTDECKFYIGSRHINYFQKMMWALRYASLTEKEKIMWPFRAVYQLSKSYRREKVMERVKKGSNIIWEGNDIIFKNESSKNRFHIFMNRRERTSFKIDILDSMYYDRETDTFVGVRDIRNFEINKGKIRRPHVLEESTPIILYVNDRASMIPLSVNMTGSIVEVNPDKNKEGKETVKYVIDVPSLALSFQKIILKKYLEIYPEMFKDVIMVQVGVDLTHIDLIALDALQRVIGEKIEKIQGLKKKEKLKGLLSSLEKEKERLDFESELGPEIMSEDVLRYFYSQEKEG